MNRAFHELVLHLSLIKGVGPALIALLCKRLSFLKNSSEWYQLTVADYMSYGGCNQNTASMVVAGLANRAVLDQELLLIAKHAVQWATMYEASYPASLKEIARPPAVVYWQGSLECRYESSIAVVGSRRATSYGKQVVHDLVKSLVQAGYMIVSGGALGIDKYAHEQSIAYEGKTVVVVGSGLLQSYPSCHKGLFDTVVAHGGALVSIFPLQMAAVAGNFPARNRIIAGLSRCCVVVQAARKSGALITAQYALEQGRDVVAVPGSLYDELSQGCHWLLSQGAQVLESTDALVKEYGVIQDVQPFAQDTVESSQEVFEVDDVVTRIIAACRVPCSADELFAILGCSREELNDRLFTLQLEGKIVQNSAGLWSRGY